MDEVVPTIKERLIAWCKGRARTPDDLEKVIALIETRPSLADADEYVKDVISHNEAMEMVHRMIHSHFNRKDAEHMRASIPANPKRDDDLRMVAYIKQQIMKSETRDEQTAEGESKNGG